MLPLVHSINLLISPTDTPSLHVTSIDKAYRDLHTLSVEARKILILRDKSGHLDRLAKIRTSLIGLSTYLSSPVVEYTRAMYTESMCENLPHDKGWKYEQCNIVERWLVSMSNDMWPYEDPVFNFRKLDPAYPATIKMKAEYKEKGIRKNPIRLIEIAQEFLRSAPDLNTPIPELDKIPREDVLKPYGEEAYVRMRWRYKSIIGNGQQLAIPQKVFDYLYGLYNITLEAFATPINSLILGKGRFCSLFPDTDAVYGSVGNFFGHDLDGESIYANPPFIEDVLNRLVDVLLGRRDYKVALIVIPSWTDARFYSKLVKSGVQRVPLNNPSVFWYQNMEQDKRVPAKFKTELCIIPGLDKVPALSVKKLEEVYKS